jgi:predicted nucleic acid-binding protein
MLRKYWTSLCPAIGRSNNGRMTRFAIDSGVAFRLLSEGARVAEGHSLVAPSRLRSEVLAQVYRSSRRGELSDRDARVMLDDLSAMQIRLLGDRVSRGTAWRIAEQLGWDDIGSAEYLAVAKLQADAFVTLDEKLARQATGIVPIADYEAPLR